MMNEIELYEEDICIIVNDNMKLLTVVLNNTLTTSDLLGLYNLISEKYYNYNVKFESEMPVKLYTIDIHEISHADIDNEELNIRSLEYGVKCNEYTTNPCILACTTK